MTRVTRRALLALPLALPAMAAAPLTVVVTGLRAAAGQVVVALHATSASFPSRFADAAAVARSTATAPETVLRLAAPAPGRYALIAVHDEDGDGVMTKNFLGLPREGYGAPGGVTRLGPPRFGAALLDIAGGETIVIPLWYPS